MYNIGKTPLVAKIAVIYPGVFFAFLGWWWTMSSLLESGNAAGFAGVGYAVPVAVLAFVSAAYLLRRRNAGV